MNQSLGFFRWIYVVVFAYVLVGPSVHATFAQQEVIDLVTNLLGEEDKDIRALAFDQIRKEVPGKEATEKFAALLSKYPADTQIGLLSALADRKDSAAAPAVRELLANTDDEPVKVAAVEALGSLGDESDLLQLVQFLSSDSAALRTAAETSLIRLPNEVSPAIVVQQQLASPELRVVLIHILTTRRAREAVPDLIAAAAEPDEAVRQAALNALAELADKPDIAAMLPLVLQADDTHARDAAEKSVAAVCLRVAGDDDPAAPVLTAMLSEPVAAQLTLLSTLGRIGGKNALARVDQTLAASDKDEHAAAVRALANWPSGAVVTRLLTIARIDADPALQKLALRALIRIAPLADDRTDELRLDTVRTLFVMCPSAAEQTQLLDRAKAIRSIATLRWVVPFLDDPTFASQAAQTIVELAHHSSLREANRAEFHQVLDRLIAESKDATVVDRAKRYKAGQTWLAPKKGT